MPPRVSEQIRVHVERLNSSGQGVAKIGNMILFIDGALPGENALVEVFERKSNYWRGRLIKLEETAPERVAPFCPHFGVCGGCDLQHLSYSAQLDSKTARVRDALIRIGKFPESVPVEPCLAAPEAKGYRNKIQLNLRHQGSGPQLGYFQRQSHKVVTIQECGIHSPDGERVRTAIQPLLLRSKLPFYDENRQKGFLRHVVLRTAEYSGKTLVVLVTGKGRPQSLVDLAQQIGALPGVSGVVQNVNDQPGNTVLGRENFCLVGEEEITEALGEIRYQISGSAFFQVNTKQATRLFRLALDLAHIRPTHRILDLYCGTGALTLKAAKVAAFAAGIESNQESIRDAARNAQKNSINNVSFYAGDLRQKEVLDRLTENLGRSDCVFLDPPRQGASPAVIQWLRNTRPLRIVYISCDPATLARDLLQLNASGFAIKNVHPVDMFPQTNHVESVALLEAQ